MKNLKPSLAVAALALVGAAVWAGSQIDASGGLMATAADRLLDALDEGQTAQARYQFDDPERLNWHFIPRERKGLPFLAMTAEQKALAFGLIQTGLSRQGALKATTIMSLEAILRDLEGGGGPVRDPERYYLSIFGEPSNRGRWGWRVEGHHLSINYTLKDGLVESATPAFFGANPAEVRQGPRQGLRTLAEIEDTSLRLLQALDESQSKTAIVEAEAPGDIPSNVSAELGLQSTPPPVDPVGIRLGDLKEEQASILDDLILTFAGNMPTEVARAWLDDVGRSGDDVRFAWYGAQTRTEPHAFLVMGPTFRIEFNNTQNGANHIHTAWRSTVGDFGAR